MYVQFFFHIHILSVYYTREFLCNDILRFPLTHTSLIEFRHRALLFPAVFYFWREAKHFRNTRTADPVLSCNGIKFRGTRTYGMLRVRSPVRLSKRIDGRFSAERVRNAIRRCARKRKMILLREAPYK